MTGTDRCATPGCPGDGRYSAPGRGHDEGCRHPVPPTDPAVTAVAEALCWPAHPGYKPGGCEPCRERAYIAVSAARPIIEAEVRERIAARIRAEVDTFAVGDYGRGHNAAMDLAARIVEGT